MLNMFKLSIFLAIFLYFGDNSFTFNHLIGAIQQILSHLSKIFDKMFMCNVLLYGGLPMIISNLGILANSLIKSFQAFLFISVSTCNAVSSLPNSSLLTTFLLNNSNASLSSVINVTALSILACIAVNKS